MKISHILGLNARTQLFSYPHNKPIGKSRATSKIASKKVLKKAGVPVPDIFAKFASLKKMVSFDWSKLPDAFALKPSRGLGGEGIIVIKRRAIDPVTKKKLRDVWITTNKKAVNSEDLRLHVQDILEGAYSIGNVPDAAFVEEYVGRHKAFRKYAFRGTPDIRIIVFNKVPVMAMLRLPTKESKGRANLHQGAIAVGVDVSTGITTRAFWKGEYITYKPETTRKLRGIKIPSWGKVLETAVKAGEAAELGYYGADVVLHPEKGPMILELNYQPGLSIQLANGAGLRKRLERVEGLEVRNSEHGVRIGRSLFAANFADRVKAEDGIKTISAIEEIKIKGLKRKKQRKRAMAKIDTGAWRTSINYSLAEELGLLQSDNILWSKRVRSSLGVEERPIVSLVYFIKGRRITTAASVAKRMSLKFPVIIGRKDLKGFLVNPEIALSEKLEKVERAKMLE